MSCYFRYMKEVFSEAGIQVSAKNKKEVDQAIHRLMSVRYKKCMPDCWSQVKAHLADHKLRKKFIEHLRKSMVSGQ